ncbi:MAG: hypothetical protein QGH51_02350 [Planctomycetota bacterium]|nr:hypothetical protein [Planctomycetota bacterium]
MKTDFETTLKPIALKLGLVLLLLLTSCKSGENSGGGSAGGGASNDQLTWDDPNTTWDNANWQ